MDRCEGLVNLPLSAHTGRWVCLLLSIVLLSEDGRGSPADAARCAPSGHVQRVVLRYVSDGDTLVLADGRRVRLIGINAPEIGRDGRPDERLARQAKTALQRFLGEVDTIGIQPDTAATDRYGRVLAHVFSDRSRSVKGADASANAACHLLESGLAWRVTIPPNLRYQPDYLAAEELARSGARGLWSARSERAPVSGSLAGSGFRLLRANIVAVDFDGDWWLAADRGFVVRIRRADQQYFDRAQLSSLVSKRVEARGWMYQRNVSTAAPGKGRGGVLLLGHPASIKVID